MWFVLRKIAGGIALAWVIVTITFFLTSLIDPQSVALNLLGPDADRDQIAQVISRLGLDRPVWERYLDWLAGALRGDLGASWFTNTDVAASIAIRFPPTLSLLVFTVVISSVVGLLLGIGAATRGGLADRALQVVGILGFAIPNIVIAIGLVFVFALQLHVFPATGYTAIERDPAAWLGGLVLPAAALSAAVSANLAQQVRGSMVDELRQGYVRTLRARGLAESRVVWVHALRNALPAGLHALGIAVIYLSGGAVLIERIFSIPGMGTLITDATARGDMPVVLGAVVFFVLLVLVINMILDIAAAALDPKARTT